MSGSGRGELATEGEGQDLCVDYTISVNTPGTENGLSRAVSLAVGVTVAGGLPPPPPARLGLGRKTNAVPQGQLRSSLGRGVLRAPGGKGGWGVSTGLAHKGAGFIFNLQGL